MPAPQSLFLSLHHPFPNVFLSSSRSVSLHLCPSRSLSLDHGADSLPSLPPSLLSKHRCGSRYALHRITLSFLSRSFLTQHPPLLPPPLLLRLLLFASSSSLVVTMIHSVWLGPCSLQPSVA
ncbi:unnamed protein product [Boreogadus saida]